MILCALNKLDNDQLTAEVRNVGGHQTHAVVAAGCGHVTHCGPLVLLRVVQEHLVSIGGASVATYRASGVIIMMVQNCPALTSYHEPAIVQSHSFGSTSSLREAGHILPGSAPVLLQDLGGCQVVAAATHNINLHNNRVNNNISPQYSALYNGVRRGSVKATRVGGSSSRLHVGQ